MAQLHTLEDDEEAGEGLSNTAPNTPPHKKRKIAFQPSLGSASTQLGKMLKQNPAICPKFGLPGTASDSMLIKALRDWEDLDMPLRELGMREDAIDFIKELLVRDAREEERKTKRKLRIVWCGCLTVFTITSVIMGAVTFVLQLTQGQGWQKAKCMLGGFTNKTCMQGDECRFEVQVTVSGLVTTYDKWSPTAIVGPDTLRTGVYVYDGPFKCCNFPVVGSAGLTPGAGASCCSFYSQTHQAFCDNFGGYGTPGCPIAPWTCGVQLQKDGRFTNVVAVKVWDAPPILQLAAAAGVFAALAVVLLGLGIFLFGWERLKSSFQPRKLLRLKQFTTSLAGVKVEQNNQKQGVLKASRAQNMRLNLGIADKDAEGFVLETGQTELSWQDSDSEMGQDNVPRMDQWEFKPTSSQSRKATPTPNTPSTIPAWQEAKAEPVSTLSTMLRPIVTPLQKKRPGAQKKQTYAFAAQQQLETLDLQEDSAWSGLSSSAKGPSPKSKSAKLKGPEARSAKSFNEAHTKRHRKSSRGLQVAPRPA